MSQHRVHTLLATPDLAWAALIREHLVYNGFAPMQIAATGRVALEHFREARPRLALIDRRLPDENGFELGVQMLLEQPLIKVVLITGVDEASPTTIHTGIAGAINRELTPMAWPGVLTYIMRGGATFSAGALEAALAATQPAQPSLAIGPLQIDLPQRQASYAGQRIQLTPREFALLACLAQNADQVVTFDQLLNEAWGYDAEQGTLAQVRLYVARLRRKLLIEARAPHFIYTERSVGYRLHSAVLRPGRNIPPLQQTP